MIARCLAFVAFSLLRIRRRVVLNNLRRALGVSRSAARRLGYSTYCELGVTFLDFLRVGRLTAAGAEELLGRRAVQELEALRAQGRGVLVLSAHLGHWDLLACAAGRMGWPVNVVTRRIKTSWIDAFWMGQRRACGVTLVPAQGSARAIRAALARNEIVALVLDQHQPDGVVVDFFGQPAATSSALARLARATGAPVIGAFMVRDASGRYCVELVGPIHYQGAADRREELRLNTQTYTKTIEKVVRAYPTQWFWVHRRWKVRPPPTPDPLGSPALRTNESVEPSV